MIKSLKTVTKELAIHECGHLVLLTLFDVVDDTVLVNKSIFSELQQHVFDLAVHKFGRIPLLYPFVGRKNRLLPPSTIVLIQEMDKIREATRYFFPPCPENGFSKDKPTDHKSSKIITAIIIIIVRRTQKFGSRNCGITYHQLSCKGSQIIRQNLYTIHSAVSSSLKSFWDHLVPTHPVPPLPMFHIAKNSLMKMPRHD